MQRYSAVFFCHGKYRHITARTRYDAKAILIDFGIANSVEPVGIYDSLNSHFEYAPEKEAEISDFIDNYKNTILKDIMSGVSKLRRT